MGSCLSKPASEPKTQDKYRPSPSTPPAQEPSTSGRRPSSFSMQQQRSQGKLRVFIGLAWEDTLGVFSDLFKPPHFCVYGTPTLLTCCCNALCLQSHRLLLHHLQQLSLSLCPSLCRCRCLSNPSLGLPQRCSQSHAPPMQPSPWWGSALPWKIRKFELRDAVWAFRGSRGEGGHSVTGLVNLHIFGF